MKIPCALLKGLLNAQHLEIQSVAGARKLLLVESKRC